ncbi:hypothetical protein VTK56DRAFT_9356 [Thermocarpiscus australiensis]
MQRTDLRKDQKKNLGRWNGTCHSEPSDVKENPLVPRGSNSRGIANGTCYTGRGLCARTDAERKSCDMVPQCIEVSQAAASDGLVTLYDGIAHRLFHSGFGFCDNKYLTNGRDTLPTYRNLLESQIT